MSKEQLAEQLEDYIENNFSVDDYDLVLNSLLNYLYQVEDKLGYSCKEVSHIIDNIQDISR